jgi:hypothetical protein
VGLDQALLSIVVGDPSLIVGDSLNEIFPLSAIDHGVEEFCVGLSIFQEADARALPLPRTIKNHQANHPFLESFANVYLFQGEGPVFLSHVKAKDDMEGHVKMQLFIG